MKIAIPVDDVSMDTNICISFGEAVKEIYKKTITQLNRENNDKGEQNE